MQTQITNALEAETIHFTASDFTSLFAEGHPGKGVEIETWISKVTSGETMLGYWDWLHAKVAPTLN